MVPTTNPGSTAIFKSLIALKTRNAVVFSPHPRAVRSTIEAARIVRDAAEAAGAPKGLVSWLEHPTLVLSMALMQSPDVKLILATGGPAMVHSAYSSGHPALGVGSGNTPAIIDETARPCLPVRAGPPGLRVCTDRRALPSSLAPFPRPQADLQLAVSSILMSKTFDNGVICASEQSAVVVDSVYDAVRAEFIKRGAYFLRCVCVCAP